jgi:hypothetical protein
MSAGSGLWSAGGKFIEAPCENRAFGHFAPHTKIIIMEIERINALGNTLIDLAARTHELRGYL